MQWELLYGGPGYFRISVFDDFRIYSSGVDLSIHQKIWHEPLDVCSKARIYLPFGLSDVGRLIPPY